MRDLWDDMITAESYADHVDQWGIYRSINRALAECAVADLPHLESPRVLDLACGTGATIEALLAHLPWDSEVLAVDAAAAMVDRARVHLSDARIAWRVARAEALVNEAIGTFDLIVCGAAWWHLDPKVYGPLLQALRPQGRLVFNVPAAQCVGVASVGHPIQAALADLLAQNMGRFPAIHPKFDRQAFDQLCAKNRLQCSWTAHGWKGPQQALIDLLQIPAMTELVAPGLGTEQADHLVAEAAARVDGDQVLSVDWWLACVEAPRRCREN